MKKLLLSVLGLSLISCSKDDIPEPVKTGCDCDKLAFQQLLTYNPQTGTGTAGELVYTGGVIKNVTNDCSKDGLNFIETATTSGNNTLQYGWIIKCK